MFASVTWSWLVVLSGAPLRCGMNPSQGVGRGVLVVGDAAGPVNPFTEEGMNSALQSGKAAAETLEAALASRDPVHASLADYSRFLEDRYSDLFRLGKTLVRSYGFLWKLLDGTFELDRPLFAGFRRAMLAYGLDEAPYAHLAFFTHHHAPRETARVAEPDLELLAKLRQVRGLITRTIESDFPILSRIVGSLADQP
jgi:hypothetical protein